MLGVFRRCLLIPLKDLRNRRKSFVNQRLLNDCSSSAPFAQRHVVTSSFPPVTAPNCNYTAQIYRRVDSYPDHAAIIDGTSGQKYSFNHLREAVSNIASGLLKKRFSKGQRVAIFSNNCPEFVFAAHGAIAGGLAVCPINGNYTAYELGLILKDSACSAIVTDRQRLKVVHEAAKAAPTLRTVFLLGTSQLECHGLKCESFDDLLTDDGSAFRNDWVEVDAENDLAFLPYSSGTSGAPKGVMLSHNNVAVNLLQAEVLFEDPVGAEVAIGVLPFFHIYALNVILGHILHVGGTVVTIPSFTPEHYLKLIEEHKATVLHLAPPLMLFLLQHPLVKQTDFSSVRRIMSGGAPLGGNIVDDIAKAMPQADVIQGYGLTETSPICFIIPREKHRPMRRSVSSSVGVSVSSQECMIVDPETKRELAPGHEGELAVRGPHVMKGYLNKPESTAECISKEGWFFTGDIGHFDDDGYFYVTDRVKELIKYKGFQVAPAEIEAVLLSHPDIIDCAVVGRRDDLAGELPTAFVVCRTGQMLDADSVHRFVAQLLSDHKQLRGGIIFTDSVPRSPSGKLLRRMLREKLNSK